MIKKYRKKPIEIDAVQWTGDNLAELRKLEGFNAVHTCFGGSLNIKTYEGVMHASVGDYIIKGVQGEFYPCKPDIFEQTYEEVKDGNTEEQPTIEPEQHWIPCSERLPENYERVLATTAWGEVTIAERIYPPIDDTCWFIHDGNTNATIDDVVAWMPLLESYSGE